MRKCWLHVALLCVMLVVVGIITRCAIQFVSCMHGHLDMLMGNRLLVLVLCMAYLMILDAVKTLTTWLHSHCLIALRSWEAHCSFDELSKTNIQVNPTDWEQVGQESEQVGQVSLHLFSSVPGTRKLNGGVAAHWLPWTTRS
jgi:hypothetical protein